MAGQTLTFTTGQVSFNGGSLTDPSLNFTATTTAGDVTATLAITGTASHPKITLSSVPSLPQDEVLAYLLYGKSSASLGPLEIAQIAATLASLAGVAPTLSNPLESLRNALGLDRLTVGAGSSLEAGRYVARDVYVGARQNVTGTGTQAVVQVDLAKGLKLEATAGTSTSQSATGAGGSADAASVGIKYQFEVLMPAARNDDSSIVSGGWYCARGCPGSWWGGRAPNQDQTSRPTTSRRVNPSGGWYCARGWWGGRAPNQDPYQPPDDQPKGQSFGRLV